MAHKHKITDTGSPAVDGGRWGPRNGLLEGHYPAMRVGLRAPAPPAIRPPAGPRRANPPPRPHTRHPVPNSHAQGHGWRRWPASAPESVVSASVRGVTGQSTACQDRSRPSRGLAHSVAR